MNWNFALLIRRIDDAVKDGGRETFQIEMKIDRRHRHRQQHLRKNAKIGNMCVHDKEWVHSY